MALLVRTIPSRAFLWRTIYSTVPYSTGMMRCSASGGIINRWHSSQTRFAFTRRMNQSSNAQAILTIDDDYSFIHLLPGAVSGVQYIQLADDLIVEYDVSSVRSTMRSREATPAASPLLYGMQSDLSPACSVVKLVLRIFRLCQGSTYLDRSHDKDGSNAPRTRMDDLKVLYQYAHTVHFQDITSWGGDVAL